jgi:hypothetical protein
MDTSMNARFVMNVVNWKSHGSRGPICGLLALGGFLHAAALWAQDPPLTNHPHPDQFVFSNDFTKQVLSEKFFAEGASFADFDGDGHNDIVSGPYWYKGPQFSERFEVYTAEEFPIGSYSQNFLTFTHDFNHDGHVDVMRVGFPGAETAWYQNPGPAAVHQKEHWKQHIIFDITDNESPGLWNIVGDDSPEFVFQTDGYFGFATPDPNDPYAKWTFHKVSEQIAGGRFSHGIGVGDVDGDGRIDFLTPGGWLQQPEDWTKGELWKYHQVAFAPAASQMYAYDFDGDGLNDILCAVHAHQWGVVWHRQIRDPQGKIDFELNWIVGVTPDQTDHQVVFTQPHAMELVDMDGDGIRDVITGKRFWAHNGADPGETDPAVLYWFKTVRENGKARFIPHLIDANSGVGTQVTVGDVNGDKKPDIVVGNKKGTFYFQQK